MATTSSSAPASLTTRLLPPEEWERLATIPPFDQGLPDPDHWRIIVVEADGQIVGLTGLFEAVHWEPWWVAPQYRQHPGVLRKLLRAGLETLQEAHVAGVFAVVSDELADQQAIVERFGFQAAPGKLYLLAVPEE